MIQIETKVDHKLQLERYKQFSQIEKEVIYYASHAYTTKEIAEKLDISSCIVRKHITHVYKTFNIRKRYNLVIIMVWLEELYPEHVLKINESD